MKPVVLSVTPVLILSLVLMGGCAKEQKEVMAELESPAPVNCATAAQDIQTLQAEKANVEERVLEGATAVYPGSAAIGLIAGIEGTKLKVAGGAYNKAIEERIAEIQAKCGTGGMTEGP